MSIQQLSQSSSTNIANPRQYRLSKVMLAAILAASGSLIGVESAIAKPLDKPIKAEGELYAQLFPFPIPGLGQNLPRNVRNAVIREASQRSGQPVGRIQVISSQQQTWPDGCLGIDDGTSLCTRALVPGWEVSVRIPNQNTPWVFRSNQDGSVIRLVGQNGQNGQNGQTGTPSRQVIDTVFRDISRRMNIPQNQLRLVGSTRQTWPNTCLGLEEPGEFCGQAFVEGWEVTVTNNRDTWVYRTDLGGRSIRLQDDNATGGTELPGTVLNAVYRDVSNRTRLPVGNFRVTEATQQTWSDSCLGLGGPNESCLFAQVPGWRVVVSEGRNNWVYRTDNTGRSVRLESDGSNTNQPGTTLLNAVYRDLSNRTRIPSNNFRLVESTRQTWPDGCLGLAEPREACTLAQVQGWRLVVSDGRTNWVYRTDLEGRVIRLETGNTSGSLPNAVTTAVFNDVANRTRINTSQLMVVDSRQQTWPNGCLGLEAQGRFCSQGAVPGWEVTVGRRNSGDRWIYRTDNTGSNVALAQVAVLDPNSAPFRFPDRIANLVRERITFDMGIPASQLRIANATQNNWSNACLDLSLPTVRCMQTPTPGWRVEVTDERNNWVYRTNADGSIIFPENAQTGNLLPDDVSKAVIRAASQRSGVPASLIQITNAQRQNWPDSCLGLSRPGVLCGAVMVPGWEVTVTAGRNNWTFRTNDAGTLVELDNR